MENNNCLLFLIITLPTSGSIFVLYVLSQLISSFHILHLHCNMRHSSSAEHPILDRLLENPPFWRWKEK